MKRKHPEQLFFRSPRVGPVFRIPYFEQEDGPKPGEDYTNVAKCFADAEAKGSAATRRLTELRAIDDRSRLRSYFNAQQVPEVPETAAPDDIFDKVLISIFRSHYGSLRRIILSSASKKRQKALGFEPARRLGTDNSSYKHHLVPPRNHLPYITLLRIPLGQAQILFCTFGLSRPLRARIAHDVTMLEALAETIGSTPPICDMHIDPSWPSTIHRQEPRKLRTALQNMIFILESVTLPLLRELWPVETENNFCGRRFLLPWQRISCCNGKPIRCRFSGELEHPLPTDGSFGGQSAFLVAPCE